MQVVRKFLIPMFEAEKRSAYSKTRASTLGMVEAAIIKPVKSLTAVSGTVYGELRLSDRLMTELEVAKDAAKRLEIQASEALHAKAAAQQELEFSATKLKAAYAELEMLRYQFDSLKQYYDQLNLSRALIDSQFEELKLSYARNDRERLRLAQELHAEKTINDKTLNRANELEHRNSLLLMENDVIGERLKGLYTAFDHVTGRLSFDERVKAELEAAAASNASFTKISAKVDEGLHIICADRDRYKESFEETVRLHNEMKQERDKLYNKLKYEGAKSELTCKRLEEERSKLADNFADLEKRHKMMTEEQDKARLKLRHLRNKRKTFGGMEEKICRNCGRPFYDSDNFNWSCRIHFSQFGGEMWWCCGKEGQNAGGCRLSKHQCKEDEEGEDSIDEEMTKEGGVRCTVSPTLELQRARTLQLELPKRPKSWRYD
jgi:hypothetical protein